MAFVFCIFIVAILFYSIESQSVLSTQITYGNGLLNLSDLEAENDNTSFSTLDVVTFTDRLAEVNESEYNYTFSSDSPFKWNDSNLSKEEKMQTEEKMKDSFSISLTPIVSDNPTLDNSETDVITFSIDSEKDTNVTDISQASLSTQTLQFDKNNTESTDRGEDISEISNVTNSLEEENVTNSSQESRNYTSFSNNEKEMNSFLLLTSDCSIVNSENIALNEDFTDVGCTIYLRVNFSLGNETRDRILNTLKKLTIKPNEFQIVKIQEKDERNESEHSRQDKHYGFLLSPETFAYLAVAIAFAFLLLLAVIVFGFRCFRKRRPSLDMSHFDVRLSNYTLTKIPRASLTSLDCLPESDGLNDKPESSAIGNKDFEGCNSSHDNIPCVSYLSNREMKTFGVSKSTESKNVDSASDMFPQNNPIAYENQTFHRYY